MQYAIPKGWLEDPVQVLVIGCGGSGSELVDSLARLHHVMLALGHPAGLEVTLCDHDVVEASNVGRQRFIAADIGLNKAQVLASRYNLAYGMKWKAIPTRFDAVNTEIDDVDVLITCVDKAALRVEIARKHTSIGNKYRYIRNRDAIWIDSGNGATTAQVIFGHLWTVDPKDDEVRLPNVYALFPNLVDVSDDEAPSCSAAESLRRQEFGINRIAVDAAMFPLLSRLLTKGTLDICGVFVDMPAGTMAPIRIDPVAWEMIRLSNQPAAKPTCKPKVRSRRVK